MPQDDVTADLTDEGRVEWDLMAPGQWYQDSHPEIERKRAEAKRLFCAYNALSCDQEAERLHHGHDGKRNANSTRLRGAKLSDKERIREIVGGGHQIGNDGRQAQFKNQRFDRMPGHLPIFSRPRSRV